MSFRSVSSKRYITDWRVSSTLLFCLMLMGCQEPARAEGYDVERLATAIYHAEGGANTRHPYGILAKYKHTTPRQACINTINHALRDWDGKGDFIRFLQRRYAPIGAVNDPLGLNRNWYQNVSYLYGMR